MAWYQVSQDSPLDRLLLAAEKFTWRRREVEVPKPVRIIGDHELFPQPDYPSRDVRWYDLDHRYGNRIYIGTFASEREAEAVWRGWLRSRGVGA